MQWLERATEKGKLRREVEQRRPLGQDAVMVKICCGNNYVPTVDGLIMKWCSVLFVVD